MKIGSIPFLQSSSMHQFHHLARCHATSIKSLFISFFICFALFIYITLSSKSDMNNSLRISFIKINIIKVNIINIYTRNTHFINRKCDISESSSKTSISFSANKELWSFLIILLVTNQLETNTGRKSLTALSHIF